MSRWIAFGVLVLCLVACGGVAEQVPDGAAGAAGGTAACVTNPPEIELDTGVCSLAHEPATRQCDADHTRVYRCSAPASQPPECLPSLDCNASVWCCPVVG